MAKKTNSTKYQVTPLTSQTARLTNLTATGVDVSQPRTVQIIHVTKAIADSWLCHNVYNRSVDGDTVEKYKRVMLRGEWTFEGYISFDSSGAVTNGQHRLWAISESGMAHDFVVVYGMEVSADTDTGRKREAIDNFVIMNNMPAVLIDKKVVGTARAMLRRKCKGHKGATNSEIEIAMKHWKTYLIDMAPIINTRMGTTWFNVALMCAYMNGVDFNEIQTFKALYNSMGSRGKVPAIEQPIKALYDTVANLPSKGTDQHMHFILTATQNALNEYIQRSGANYCVSSKDPIWDYDCVFMNSSNLTGGVVTNMYY